MTLVASGSYTEKFEMFMYIYVAINFKLRLAEMAQYRVGLSQFMV